jgi:hypothetical protein
MIFATPFRFFAVIFTRAIEERPSAITPPLRQLPPFRQRIILRHHDY